MILLIMAIAAALNGHTWLALAFLIAWLILE